MVFLDFGGVSEAFWKGFWEMGRQELVAEKALVDHMVDHAGELSRRLPNMHRSRARSISLRRETSLERGFWMVLPGIRLNMAIRGPESPFSHRFLALMLDVGRVCLAGSMFVARS